MTETSANVTTGTGGGVLSEAEIAAIVAGKHGDPFAALGVHEIKGGFLPAASSPAPKRRSPKRSPASPWAPFSAATMPAFSKVRSR